MAKETEKSKQAQQSEQDNAPFRIFSSGKPLLNVLKFALFLSIGLVLMYFAFKNVDLENILDDFKRANYIYVIISFILGYLAYVAIGLRWLILLDTMGYHKVRAIDSINSVAITYFTNLFILRAGEVTRCVALNRAEGIPMSKLLGTVILERIIDFILLAGVIVLTFILSFGDIRNFFADVMGNPDSILYKVFNHTAWIYAGIAFVIVVPLLYFFLRKKLRHTILYHKIKDFLKGILTGIYTIRYMKQKWAFIAYTIFIWLMYYMMIYVMKFALPETSSIDLVQGLFILAVGGCAQVMPAQGGIGAYHLAVKTGLLLLGISAITPEIALSFATLAHATQTLVALLMGGIALWMISRAATRRISALHKQDVSRTDTLKNDN